MTDLQNPLVSVIVPVWNVEPYLRQCLDSLVTQTLQDIEIVCVDDGSTDGSGVILDEYAAKDARVRVVHQPNGGAGKARNAGLDLARGDYLFFCDPDDWAETDMLERMHAAAAENGADVVLAGRYVETGEEGAIEPKRLVPPEKAKDVFRGVDLGDDLFKVVKPYPWEKLFRRQHVVEQGIRYQEIVSNNDWYFTYSAVTSATRIVSVDKAFYHYRINREGSLQNTKQKSPLCWLMAIDAVAERLRQTGLLETFSTALLDVLVRSGSLETYKVPSAADRLEFYAEVRKRVLAFCESFPNSVEKLGEDVRRRLEILRREESPEPLAAEMIGASRVKRLELRATAQSLRQRNGALEKRNGALAEKNETLRTDNAAVRQRNAELKEKNETLRTDNAAVKQRNAELKKRNHELKERNRDLKERNGDLKERVLILRKRPNTILQAVAFIFRRVWLRLTFRGEER